jgi:uncharacterized Zn-binding protein involved in type VI secretion
MGKVCRANIDKAGGIILGGSSTVFIDGFPVALQGNRISDHGDNEHNSPVVINGTSRFIVDGTPVIIEGYSKGTCGHLATSGSTVIAS